MAEGLTAFCNQFDEALILQKDLCRMLGQTLHIYMYTDSKQISNAITKEKYTTEEKLMVDTAAISENYNNHEIKHGALIHSKENPADALTTSNDDSMIDDVM